MPRLLTRMSTAGVACTRAAAPSSVAASANTPLTWAPPEARMLSTAWPSLALLRPVMITLAPSTASLRAISRPMPAVEPVTRADLLFRRRSMMVAPSERHAARPLPILRRPLPEDDHAENRYCHRAEGQGQRLSAAVRPTLRRTHPAAAGQCRQAQRLRRQSHAPAAG